MARNGFVRESPTEWPVWTEFDLWSVKLPRARVEAAKRYIHQQAHSGKTFSYGGIVGVVLNRPIEDKEAMFCSEFVERACLAAGLAPSAPNPALTTPVGVVQRPGATRLTGGVLRHYITANFSTRQNLVAEEAELSLF